MHACMPSATTKQHVRRRRRSERLRRSTRVASRNLHVPWEARVLFSREHNDDEGPDEEDTTPSKPRTKPKPAKQRRDCLLQGPPASPTKRPRWLLRQPNMPQEQTHNRRRARRSHESAKEIQPSIERQQSTKMVVALFSRRSLLWPDFGRARSASS